jgi:hypothetical protein
MKDKLKLKMTDAHPPSKFKKGDVVVLIKDWGVYSMDRAGCVHVIENIMYGDGVGYSYSTKRFAWIKEDALALVVDCT